MYQVNYSKRANAWIVLRDGITAAIYQVGDEVQILNRANQRRPTVWVIQEYFATSGKFLVKTADSATEVHPSNLISVLY